MEKTLLILDLDETLIHGWTPNEKDDALGWSMTVCGYHIKFRANAKEFISEMSKYYKIAVWTYSLPEYAIPIIYNLFCDIPLEFIRTRKHCSVRRTMIGLTTFQSSVEKRIKKLFKVYDKKRIIIIDDKPCTFRNNTGNGIQVSEYHGNENDNELEKLGEYLKTIANCKNVRAVNKRNWKQQTDPRQ